MVRMMVFNLAQAPPKVQAGFLIGFGALVLAAASATLLLAVTNGHPAFWVAGPIILAVAVVMLVAGIRWMRNEVALERADSMLPVRPQPARGAQQPWTWQQLAGDIAARFDGQPVVVIANDDRIRVTADLADATFMTPLALRNVRDLYTVDVERAGARVRIETRSQQVEAQAGPDGTRLVATGRVRASTGVVLRRTKRIEYGADADGWGRKVDIDFSSGSLSGPVKSAVRDAGLKLSWGPNGIGAIIVAGLALLAVPLVPLMLWLQSIGVVPPSP